MLRAGTSTLISFRQFDTTKANTPTAVQAWQNTALSQVRNFETSKLILCDLRL